MTSAPHHVSVPAGRKAALALRDVIAERKAGDPLAPVTVVVPSTLAGLSLRRLLASGGLDEPGAPVTGIANVGFTVVGRLLELLGAPMLAAAGRRRLDPAVRAEAVRAELLAEPGVFAAVAYHPATERRLDATFTELRGADEPTLERLAEQSPRSAEIVRLFRAVEGRLGGWYDDVDLLEPALAAVQLGGHAVTELGHLVLYAGRVDDTEARALTDAFGDRATIIDTTTTDPAPVGTAVVSASDPDDEVRRAVREVLHLVQAGTPLHRIAIAHPGASYPLLVHQHLAAADIPHNGQGVQTLAQTAAGRALLGALGLLDHDFRRDDVLGWLASAPLVQSDGRWVPLARWDRLSRRAGVVGGVEQWSARLTANEAELVAEAERLEADPADAARATRRRDDAASVARLRAYVVGLADELTATDRTTWADHVDWASRLLQTLIGTDAARAGWPEPELAAADRVQDTLAGLAGLDELGTAVDLTTFRRAVERDLDVPASRLGPFGDGVLVSSLRPLRGVDLDAVVVVGLAEGLAPLRSREDALLPDRERGAAGPSLHRPDRLAEQHDDLLAVLAAARGPRVLCFPRADLASGRHHLPSRWLLDTASALANRRVYSDDLPRLAGTGFIEEVPSFTAGLQQEPAVSLLDRDLGRLLAWQARNGRSVDHPLATEEPELGAGLRAIDARESETFTAFDGNVDPASVPELAPDRPLSATSLETYATCPRRYFFSRVLGLRQDERPEDLEQIAPAARGTLVHGVLESYTGELIAGESRDEHRLLDIAEEHFDDVEARGLTGRPLRWAWDKRVIEEDLLRIHDEDVLEPVAAELAFGVGDEPPVEVELGNGRRLTFKGFADRVDRAPDGTIVVTDYKTGSTRHFKDLDKTFVDRGRKLQLPIYGLAAKDRFGGKVHSQYWFVSDRGGFKKIGYDLDDGLPTFLATVGAIADGIADGVFPANPGEPVDWPSPSWESCTYCEFNRICPADRSEQWLRNRQAPELAAYVALADPDPEPQDDGGDPTDGAEG